MRKRKTKREKIKRDKRRLEYQRQMRELILLKEKLQKKVNQKRIEVIKAFHVRNLHVFRDTCNVLAPFVVCAGLTVGSFLLLDGGLPIRIDNVSRGKQTDLVIEEPGSYPSLSEEYVYDGKFCSSLESSYLKITTPWIQEPAITYDDEFGPFLRQNQNKKYSPWDSPEEHYVRYTRKISISGNEKEIVDLIIQKDYQRLFDYFSNYNEEVEYTNHPFGSENEYTITGEIHFRDSKDRITYPESDNKNIIISLIEAFIVLSLGGIVTHKRRFSYIESLEDNQNRYRFVVKVYKEEVEKLEEVKTKILTLENGGRTNDN